VTEKRGRLRVVTRDGKVLPPVPGLPRVDARGQGGLLDVAVRREGAGTTLCLTYAEPRGGGRNGTAAYCGEARGSSNISVQNGRVVFRQMPAWDSTGHYGSRIAFAPDGRMYITLGDRQRIEARNIAQRMDNTFGKVVRLEPNGMSAPDNPFYAKGPGTPRTQIWSMGHRNVQSAAIHPRTGKLWTVEHGTRGGDELNVPAKGRNYGWPVVAYGIEYDGRPIGAGLTRRAGTEQPIYYWDPVIAPSGMAFYEGKLFPKWRGSLFIGGLGSEALVRLTLDGERVVGEERFPMNARIRDVGVGPDGAIYLLTDEEDGRLLRLVPRT
jgi:glucose/arabinose dehydrogenase